VTRIATLIAVVVVALSTAGAASPAASYESFYARVSAYALSSIGLLQVNGYASYRDYDCTPSYACDRNVMVEFTVHRGLSTYSPVVGRAYDETGQYGSSASATFRLPTCRLIRKYTSITYTVEMVAVAPTGLEKTASTFVYHRSCQ